eukprot:m51a1_g4910 hypothetical protein (150) ;mRNA; r:187296-188343
MLNAVRSIKDKIKGAKQAGKEMSSASGDETESSSSKSIDELQGKKVAECNRDNDQEEHKEKATICKRTRKKISFALSSDYYGEQLIAMTPYFNGWSLTGNNYNTIQQSYFPSVGNAFIVASGPAKTFSPSLITPTAVYFQHVDVLAGRN